MGLAATALAAAAVIAWIAIGTLFISRVNEKSVLFLPGSILVGAGVTSAVLAAAARSGFVREGTIAITLAAMLVALVRRRAVAVQIRRAAQTIRDPIRDWPVGRWLLVAVVITGWVYAIAPPRDGDVMRYHLAHIRQIISDGAWLPIADLTYGFPFAWSLNYLPFELIGLPQTAHLVNLALSLIVAITLIRVGPASLSPRTNVVVILIFLAHPFVVRTFTSALADGYAILATTVVVVGLLGIDSLDRRAAGLLGFSTWIGIGSRYQLVAVGLAGSALFIFHAVRSRRLRPLIGFAGGTAVAMLLASPFYIANFYAFGNPVWPLLVPRATAASSYANEVASAFITGYATSPAAGFRVSNAMQLLATPEMAPIPLLIVILVAVSLWSRRSGVTYVASFAALFLVMWELMSPRLYPTHILPLLPVGPVLLAGVAAAIVLPGFVKRLAHSALIVCAAGLAMLSAFFCWDYARYAATGNSSKFHRYTWYYPTYTWVNRNTPPSSRFLVVALSGHTYYLDRRYRRADPWLSGEVDWRRVSSPAALDSVMSGSGYDYLIFDDRNWSLFPGGAQMGEVVRAGMVAGTLVPVHHSRELLYTSRVRRTASRASVYVLRRVPRP